MALFFAGLFLIVVAVLVLIIKYYFVFTGERVQGEIIGLEKGARSTMNRVGYNYMIRFTYQDKQYVARAIQSKIGTTNRRPKIPKNTYCIIYFNPKSPKVVSMTGFSIVDVACGVSLILGLLGVFLPLCESFLC